MELKALVSSVGLFPNGINAILMYHLPSPVLDAESGPTVLCGKTNVQGPRCVFAGLSDSTGYGQLSS